VAVSPLAAAADRTAASASKMSSTSAFGKPNASPGPIYYPDDRSFGHGPHGVGPEFSILGSHRAPIEERLTKQVVYPGPQYMLPDGLGRQVISTFRSFNVGKFSEAPRKTMDPGPERSPGPAAYNRESLGLTTVVRQHGVAPLTTGMGSAERFFDKATRTGAVPGPGAYKLPTSIGGNHPANPSKPNFAFSKGDARQQHSMKTNVPDPCSPGPAAKYQINASVGRQALSTRATAGKFGFGTATRFPCAPEENQQHREILGKIKKRAEAIAARGTN
jgi:hypothetical protein